MERPRLAMITQRFDSGHIENVAGTVSREIAGLNLSGKIRPGSRVAVTAGSRESGRSIGSFALLWTL